jgi:hypothetical protein
VKAAPKARLSACGGLHFINRVFKNKHKHQAVSQGVRRFGKRSPPAADEHLQKPHNAGSRSEARFFNTLLKNKPSPADLERVCFFSDQEPFEPSAAPV